MNIIKKIKNWLIKKLGGYTEEECNEAVGGIRLEDKYKEHWHEAFRTEHANYIALLNCHNAAASAAQNGTAGVAGAIDTIKAYCASKNNCNECALYRAGDGCKFLDIPCYWGE